MIFGYRRLLREQGGPPTLYIGSSHVTHLATYAKRDSTLPTIKRALNRSHYIGVGGSTWMECLQHIQGKSLPKRKQGLGNQWQNYLDLDITPTYITIVMGSNDVDQFQQSISARDGSMDQRQNHWETNEVEQNAAFNRITVKILEFLNFIKDEFPSATLLYVNIVPRAWWGAHARQLARWLNYYILCTLRRRFRVKEIWVHELFASKYDFFESPMFGMLNCDMTHMNMYGYKAFIQATMRPLLHMWARNRNDALAHLGIKRY